MLAERPQASTGDTRTSGAGSARPDSGSPRNRADVAGTGSFGSRSARKKRSLFRRTGVALPAAGLALLLVVGVWAAAKVMDPQGTGASSLFQSIDGLGNSGSVALLEQERQTLIEMTAASKSLMVASKPAMTNPDQLLQEQNSSTSESSDTTGGTGIATTAPPSDPTAAQATAKSMLTSFGFSESTQ